MLNLSDIVRRRAEVVAQETAEGTVLVDMRVGDCFEMNRVAALFWTLIEEPQPLEAVCQKILAWFPVDRTIIERDAMALTDSLARAGLVEVTRAPLEPLRVE